MDLVWLESAQTTDLPAKMTRPYSTAHRFLTRQRRDIAPTVTEPGVVVVATNKDGWTITSTTDPNINLGIDYLASDIALCRIIPSHISFRLPIWKRRFSGSLPQHSIPLSSSVQI